MHFMICRHDYFSGEEQPVVAKEWRFGAEIDLFSFTDSLLDCSSCAIMLSTPWLFFCPFLFRNNPRVSSDLVLILCSWRLQAHQYFRFQSKSYAKSFLYGFTSQTRRRSIIMNRRKKKLWTVEYRILWMRIIQQEAPRFITNLLTFCYFFPTLKVTSFNLKIVFVRKEILPMFAAIFVL